MVQGVKRPTLPFWSEPGAQSHRGWEVGLGWTGSLVVTIFILAPYDTCEQGPQSHGLHS